MQLQLLCLDADYVIDLHTSAGQGLDYLFYFQRREQGARSFLLPVGLWLDRYDGDAIDEAFIKPWLALENCLAQLDRAVQFDIEAYTLELGSAMQLNPTSVVNGIRGMKNYLIQKGLMTDSTFPNLAPPDSDTQLMPRGRVKKYHAPTGGMIQSAVSLGDFVESEQLLYQILSFNKAAQLPALIEVCAEREESDVDILIDYTKAPSLLQLIELEEYLSDQIGDKVEVVTRNGLKERIRARVLAEVLYV